MISAAANALPGLGAQLIMVHRRPLLAVLSAFLGCLWESWLRGAQSPGEAPVASRPRMGDAWLRARLQDLEAELSEMDACADELEAELDELHSDSQALHSRVVQLEVSLIPSGSAWTGHAG